MPQPSPRPRARPDRNDDAPRRVALVLVAAGDRRTRARLGRTLAGGGHCVVHAATAAAALARVGERRPDLVIADVRAAGIDERELVGRLRDGTGTGPGVVLLGEAGADGETRAAEAGADAYLSAGARSRELLETVRAVLAERELRRERGLSAAFLDHAPDATVMVDASGRIAVVNSALERLFGYRREELLGEPLEILLPERLRARHAAHRIDYVRSPRRRSMGSGVDLAGRRKDGSEVAVDISLGPLSVEGATFVLATIRDVTERRRAEAEERALRRVATAVAAEAGPEEVFSLVAEEAAALLGADAGRVSRFEGDRARAVGTWGAGSPPVGTLSPLAGGRAAAQVAREGRAARVDDYARLRRHDPISRRVLPAGYRSGLAAPVRVGGRLWGTVTV